ncbi:MAG: hypothetical protein AB1Z98_27085 [Nannocystaceae bacterium]
MKSSFVACCLLLSCSAAAPDPKPLEGRSAAVQRPGSTLDVSPQTAPAALAAPPAEREPEPEPERAAEPPKSRTDDAIAALRELSADPEPEHTTNDTHYLVSNERRHDLFRPELDDRGGVQLGVGTDQHYVMAGWSRPELIVVVDFDQQVVELHEVYGALMGAAPTVEEFRRLWTEQGAVDARAALNDAIDDRDRRERLLTRYDDTRPLVDKRLRKLAKRYAQLGVHSYLDTPEQYRFVAELHAAGRVIAIRGDFTQDGVLRQVARVLDEHGLAISVLYLSNIEQYLSYRKPFRANMTALPLAEDAVVLRTLPGKPAGFHYFVQSGEDFLAWMRAKQGWTVYRMVGLAKGEHLEANRRVVLGGPGDDDEASPGASTEAPGVTPSPDATSDPRTRAIR